jgi:hypothetical protein
VVVAGFYLGESYIEIIAAVGFAPWIDGAVGELV